MDMVEVVVRVLDIDSDTVSILRRLFYDGSSVCRA